VAPALPPAAAAGGATKWNARVRPVPVGARPPCVAPRLVTLASRRGAARAPRAALGLRPARPAGAARAWRPAHLCIRAACAPQRHGAPAADPRRWATRAPARLGYVQSRVQSGGLSRAAPRRAGGARQRPGRGGRGGLAHAARWPAPGPAAQVPDRAHRGRQEGRARGALGHHRAGRAARRRPGRRHRGPRAVRARRPGRAPRRPWRSHLGPARLYRSARAPAGVCRTHRTPSLPVDPQPRPLQRGARDGRGAPGAEARARWSRRACGTRARCWAWTWLPSRAGCALWMCTTSARPSPRRRTRWRRPRRAARPGPAAAARGCRRGACTPWRRPANAPRAACASRHAHMNAQKKAARSRAPRGARGQGFGHCHRHRLPTRCARASRACAGAPRAGDRHLPGGRGPVPTDAGGLARRVGGAPGLAPGARRARRGGRAPRRAGREGARPPSAARPRAARPLAAGLLPRCRGSQRALLGRLARGAHSQAT